MKRSKLAISVLGFVLMIGLTNSRTAEAQSELSFHGTLTINCFGCGTSTGSAALKVTGQVNGTAKVEAPLGLTFTVNEGPAVCPVVGNAGGTYSGAANGTFAWTRQGSSVVISTSGDINGAGLIEIVPTDPPGFRCGQPLKASVAGALAGT